jgi:hypothetical protein
VKGERNEMKMQLRRRTTVRKTKLEERNSIAGIAHW